MNDTFMYMNHIVALSVDANDKVKSRWEGWNTTGSFLRQQTLKCLSMPAGSSPGALLPIQYMNFRVDGTAALGSYGVWVQNGTAIGTRYTAASGWVASLGFAGTYSATSNVLCRAVTLEQALIAPSSSNPVGDYTFFWSTSIYTAAGSAGKIIVQWTISQV